ncbi:hypothetical protein [Phenylobacterium sp.]|uniref:hypothetical protein n=1 Tax=Phenylobacterium sp. TaxID=1871053 RepID=UPI00398353E2
MAEIHTLRISFEGTLQGGPEPWMWALVEVLLEDQGPVKPGVSARVAVPFAGNKGVFEMRELAWQGFRAALAETLAAGEGKTAEQLSFTGGA